MEFKKIEDFFPPEKLRNISVKRFIYTIQLVHSQNDIYELNEWRSCTISMIFWWMSTLECFFAIVRHFLGGEVRFHVGVCVFVYVLYVHLKHVPCNCRRWSLGLHMIKAGSVAWLKLAWGVWHVVFGNGNLLQKISWCSFILVQYLSHLLVHSVRALVDQTLYLTRQAWHPNVVASVGSMHIMSACWAFGVNMLELLCMIQ